jgi:dipeptidyl aminopeptidase/acylaminoacyl peptidase
MIKARHWIGATCFLLATMSTPFISGCNAATLGKAKEVAFTAKLDGSTQLYMERLPEGFKADKEHHILIALHGHGSDRNQGVGDRDEFKAAQDAAAKYEMIYISPDYRAPTSWMGPKAEADMVQIIADLKAKYKVGKVFLTGASMGGTSVLAFAALHPELIAGVCSQNGTANFFEYQTVEYGIQEAIKASFGGTKAEVPLEYKKRSAEYWPERFTMPVAMIAGGGDLIVPPQSVMRLAGVLKEMKRPVLLDFRGDRGHATSYEDTMAGLEFVITTALGLNAKPAVQTPEQK